MVLEQVSPNRRFRLSDAIEEIPCGGASWTLNRHHSMKIRENPEHVLSGLQIFFDFTMC